MTKIGNVALPVAAEDSQINVFFQEKGSLNKTKSALVSTSKKFFLRMISGRVTL